MRTCLCGRKTLTKTERQVPTPRLTVIGLDFTLVRDLATGLERSIAWDVTITGGTLYVTTAGATLEALLEPLAGQD